MRMGRISMVAAVWIMAGLAAGCATTRESKDLVNYVNQGVLNIAELERRSLEQYASVTGGNYTTDQRVYEVLRDEVVPLYKRFVDGLRNIQPETEDVKKLHRTYLMGAQQLYEGFKEKMYGIEIGNERIIRSGNEKIEQGRVENEKWRNELEALAKKYKVKEAKK